MAFETPTVIQLHQLRFASYISARDIQERVGAMGRELAERIPDDQPPVFLVMLKGAFVFAADLIRACGLSGEVDFVRTRSYKGLTTEESVEILLPPDPDLIKGVDVVLIEDIVDSGLTMQAFLPKLQALGPRSITLVTLLHKPEAQRVEVPIDLVGFSIPDKFVVGYGLDYDGLGRQLPQLYQVLDQI